MLVCDESDFVFKLSVCIGADMLSILSVFVTTVSTITIQVSEQGAVDFLLEQSEKNINGKKNPINKRNLLANNAFFIL